MSDIGDSKKSNPIQRDIDIRTLQTISCKSVMPFLDIIIQKKQEKYFCVVSKFVSLVVA